MRRLETITQFRYVAIIITTVVSGGCTSFDKKMNVAVGLPIDRLLATEGTHIEKTENLDALGRSVYLEVIEKNCRVFWSVSTDGTIAAWRSEGSACKYYTN